MPGPPPKREAQRRRRNKDGIQTISVDLDKLIAEDVDVPVPPVRWVKYDLEKHGERDDLELGGITGEDLGFWVDDFHPIALQAYWSLASSGQSIFMEPSDWATALALCEMLSRELKPKPIVVDDGGEAGSHIEWVEQPVNGAVMNAFLKGWASLMATEGDRRRLRMEFERKKAKDAAASGGNVAQISKLRSDRFKKAGGAPA
jgi:hypothetical protein